MAEETSNLPVVNAIGNLQRTSSSGDIQISNILSGGFNRLSRGIFGLQDSFIDISQRQQELAQQQVFDQQRFFKDSVDAQYSTQNRGLNLLQTILGYIQFNQLQKIGQLEQELSDANARREQQGATILSLQEKFTLSLENLTNTFAQLQRAFDVMIQMQAQMVIQSSKQRQDELRRGAVQEHGEDKGAKMAQWWERFKRERVEEFVRTGQRDLPENMAERLKQAKIEGQLGARFVSGMNSLQDVIWQTKQLVEDYTAGVQAAAAATQQNSSVMDDLGDSLDRNTNENKALRRAEKIDDFREDARRAAERKLEEESGLVRGVSMFMQWMKKREETKARQKELDQLYAGAEQERFGIGGGMLGILRFLASPIVWKTAIAGFATYGAYKIYKGFTEEISDEQRKQIKIQRKQFLESRGLEANNWKKNLLGPLEGLFTSNNKELNEIQAYHRDQWEEGNAGWFVALKEWWEGIVNWWKNLNLNPFDDANAAGPVPNAAPVPKQDGTPAQEYAPGFAPVAPRTPSEMVVPKKNDGAAVNGASSAVASQASQPIIIDGSKGGDVTTIDQSVNTKVQMPKNVGFTKPMAPDSSGMYGRNFGWLGP